MLNKQLKVNILQSSSGKRLTLFYCDFKIFCNLKYNRIARRNKESSAFLTLDCKVSYDIVNIRSDMHFQT